MRTVRKYDVIVVGGGASGLFAAAHLCRACKSVLICEPNRFLGRKLRITGKGRCNVTNNCTAEEVMKNVPRNAKFLYSALAKLPPQKIMDWFESEGVPLKTERGRRVFPQSDSAADIADALAGACQKAEILREKVSGLVIEDGFVRGLRCKDKVLYSQNVIIATGGMSYPRTGSDGSGYCLAEEAGHTVTAVQPSLVPIELAESFCARLEGLTLKNVTLSLWEVGKKKPLFTELGELTFESYGISGPLGLSASCLMKDDKIVCKAYKLYIDFKPALDTERLDARLMRDMKAAPQGSVGELLAGLLPRAVADVFADILRLDKTASTGNLPREKRIELVTLLKRFELNPTALRGFDEAIITRGGVSVKELNPSTMESKYVNGLYFTGEVIDCDAYTGGYNLTIAFSTAFCAADDIINKEVTRLWD